jgi:hypothetical protein
MTRVSVDATELRACSAAEALAFADRVLGDADSWGPSMIAYRLQSSFQADWKVEVGAWLMLAKRLGFLTRLLNRLGRAFEAAGDPELTGANDSAHRILLQELAPAMTTHYFVASGWGFVEWEPDVALGDVDVRLRCPRGVLTDIQVKAPDQPGEVRDSRIHDGEYDERILRAIDKGLLQLRNVPGPQRMLVVIPQRVFPVEARVLTKHLVGPTQRSEDGVVLYASNRGVFANAPGNATSAVIDLSLLRGIDEILYRCTAFLNPWTQKGIAPDLSVFKNARVCHLDGTRFVWTPEAPERCFSLPSGTRYEVDGNGA